jgi:hypothetical protein
MGATLDGSAAVGHGLIAIICPRGEPRAGEAQKMDFRLKIYQPRLYWL